ncbi:MAG: hypothetical protein M0Z99_32960 [Betaproteobacteria bacterium]|nr:hypothetical protein [Betaproteobacteria bacterium]
MMEYLFFDAGLRDKFVQHVRGLGVQCTQQDDPLGLVVGVPEDLPDTIEASLEACYELLRQEEARLVEQSEGGLKKHLAGIQLQLPDGRSCMVALQPDIASRLMACLSLEEIQDLFANVANCALQAENGPLCKR